MEFFNEENGYFIDSNYSFSRVLPLKKADYHNYSAKIELLSSSEKKAEITIAKGTFIVIAESTAEGVAYVDCQLSFSLTSVVLKSLGAGECYYFLKIRSADDQLYQIADSGKIFLLKK